MKKGMTLTEVVVAIGIMGILGAGMGLLMRNSYKFYNYSHRELGSLELASKVMRDFEKTTRGYEPSNQATRDFYEVSATRLTFTAYQQGDVYPASSKISYYLDGGTFYKTVTAPTVVDGLPTYPEADKKTTIVAARVTNTSLFTYFDGNGATLAIPPDLSKIRMIQLSITINAGVQASESTVVQLRNLKTNL